MIRLQCVCAVLIVLCGIGPVQGQAPELIFATRFSMDDIPARNWEQELVLRWPLWQTFSVLGSVQYAQLNQEAFQGIRALSTWVVSPQAGISCLLLGRRLALEGMAGLDQTEDYSNQTYKAEASFSLPIPENPVFLRPNLKARAWQNYRDHNISTVVNQIRSRGYASGLGFRLWPGIDAYAHYEIQSYAADNPVLDTAYLEPRLGGIAIDTLAENTVTRFYGYAYKQVLARPVLHLGYAYSWADSREDRWVATWSQPDLRGRPPFPTLLNYTYYPYVTPLDARAHLALAILGLPIQGWMLETKWTFPVVSSRTALMSSAVLYAGMPAPSYYRENNTGPLTVESKLKKGFNRMSFELKHLYFCVPYREYSYFTVDKYAAHQIEFSMKLKFTGGPRD